jgi:hypothetical protein
MNPPSRGVFIKYRFGLLALPLPGRKVYVSQNAGIPKGNLCQFGVITRDHLNRERAYNQSEMRESTVIVAGKESALDAFDCDVESLNVDLLNAIGGGRVRHQNGYIDQGLGTSAPFAEQTNCGYTKRFRGFDGPQNIGGITARGHDHQQIAFLPICGNEPREDLIKSKVIGDTCNVTRVRKSDRWKRAAVGTETSRPLLGEMHCITHTSSIAAGHQEPSSLEGSVSCVGELGDTLHTGGIVQECLKSVGSLLKRGSDRGLHHGTAHCGNQSTEQQVAAADPFLHLPILADGVDGENLPMGGAASMSPRAEVSSDESVPCAIPAMLTFDLGLCLDL